MRVALTPFLQAEADVRYMLREDHAVAEEAAVMHGVADWKPGEKTFHSEKRWMPPATDTMPHFA